MAEHLPGFRLLAFIRPIAYNPSVNKTDESQEYRKLPSVDELLRHEQAAELLRRYPRGTVTDGLREALARAREGIAAGGNAADSRAIVDSAEQIIASAYARSLRRAINATGVIIHTGLGRARLCAEAVEAVAEAARDHSTLEIDLETGKRGSRQEHVIGLLTELTGAESALVVNNNAGAVLLAINTLARGGEVIVSRGQLVEIGGSFRLPDIIARAGARVVEVGTTNRTRVSDYDDAIRAHAKPGATPTELFVAGKRQAFRNLNGWTQQIEPESDEALDLVMKNIEAYRIPNSRTHQRWLFRRMQEVIDEHATGVPLGALRRDTYERVAQTIVATGFLPQAPTYAEFYRDCRAAFR